MSEKKPKLKPCPFCGGVGAVLRNDGSEYKWECSDCGANAGWEYSETEAAAAWNRRAKGKP